MLSARKLRRLALVGFALVCVILLGGLAWATHATLRLEKIEAKEIQTQAQAKANTQAQAKLRLALWRMDSWFMPILALESGRPYSHYSAYYRPAKVRSLEGIDVSSQRLVLPSPLLTTPVPDFVDVYFQVVDGRWSSPHLPRFQSLWGGQDSPLSHARQKLMEAALNDLELGLSSDYLDLRFAEAYSIADRYAQAGRLGEPLPSDEPVTLTGSYSAKAADQEQLARRQNLREFESRWSHSQLAQRRSLPQVACDPVEIVSGNVYHPLDPVDFIPTNSDTAPMVGVEVSAMLPLWYTNLQSGERKLIFFRTVQIEDSASNAVHGHGPIYQGFMLDWQTLSGKLLNQINDLYPTASLSCVETGEKFDSHRMLTTIPARLDVAPIVTATVLPVFNASHWMLLVSWVMALLVLMAVGWGFGSLLVLANRRMEFAYAVTHELRTPLTTLRLYADMLASGLVPESTRQEYLDTLNRESKRLADLVSGVLEYARVENRKVKLNVATTTCAHILERARETFTRSCQEQGVRFVATSQGADEFEVTTDVDLLLCVAGSLVTNACRHGKNDHQQSEVLMQLGHNGNRLTMDVIDTGMGVAASDARHLYKPFRRGKSAESTAKGGVGLGLALARNWSKLLGGKLELVARKHPVKGGAHFRLTVPI